MKFVALLSLFVASTFAASGPISCGEDNNCPEDKPCCSQYGQCGTGLYCLGGCDVRYSYNITACMPMPIMDEFLTTFDSTDKVLDQNDYLGNSLETDWIYTGHLTEHDDALLMQMPKYSGGTVISSTKYLWYGKVSATLKTSHDGGVVTAFILFSNVQDEIDYEFVGNDLTQAQNNYYALGHLNYSNAKDSSLSDTFQNYHTYEIDWKNDLIEWIIDGTSVRTLDRKDTWNDTSKRFEFPQTPARVQFSLWPGGNATNAKGTIEWAGGPIDWDSDDIKNHGYYYAYLKNVTVEPYGVPDGVKKVGNLTGKFNNYLYNKSTGDAQDVVLTDRLAWLGNDDATGFDPDNDSSSSSSLSSLSSKSKSKTSSKGKSTGTGTSTSTSTGSSDDGNSGDSGSGGDDSTTTSAYTYGGFMQNIKSSTKGGSQQTSASSGSSSLQKNDANLIRQGIAGVMGAVLLGIGSFLL